MINLSAYENRSVEVMIGKDKLHIPELSHGLYMEVVKNEDKEGNEESYTERSDLTLKMMNRNKEGKKFTMADLDTMPEGALIAIFREVVFISRQALKDPNS